MNELGLNDHIFPGVVPSGTPIGEVAAHSHNRLSELKGIPVAIAGHDHICAAFAAGAYVGGIGDGLVFDSMGTAESLIGAFPERRLSDGDYQTGLSFGLHTWPGFRYWIGGISASGGSLEWLRKLFTDKELSFDKLDMMLYEQPVITNGPLFFPYLSGSGSPRTDSNVRAAFIGIENRHGRADLYHAALEGTAFEMEYIRQRAGSITRYAVNEIVAAGRGTQNRYWMQLKADIFGIPIVVLPHPEAACLGAALLAGLGAGVYENTSQICDLIVKQEGERFIPDDHRHIKYQERYKAYLEFQIPLRRYGNGRIAEETQT